MQNQEETSIVVELTHGVHTIRHEFQDGPKEDVFVVFEHGPLPFWRRSTGIHHLYTDYTFEDALSAAKKKKNKITHTQYESDGLEYLHYLESADATHEKYRTKNLLADLPQVLCNL